MYCLNCKEVIVEVKTRGVWLHVSEWLSEYCNPEKTQGKKFCKATPDWEWYENEKTDTK